jgi:hypothetical protein
METPTLLTNKFIYDSDWICLGTALGEGPLVANTPSLMSFNGSGSVANPPFALAPQDRRKLAETGHPPPRRRPPTGHRWLHGVHSG